MDFKLILTILLVATAIVSAIDYLVWRKHRLNKLATAKSKSRNIDFEKAQEILKKPEWVQSSDTLFVVSCVVALVWYMLPNFELILVVALFISFVITLIEKLYLEKKKKADLEALYQQNANASEAEAESVKKMPWWIDYGWSFFPLLLLIVGLRSFFYEPFKIPSGSMKPTLWVHDFILVNKFEYGLRLPVTKTKITEGTPPKRGDVIVFRAPHEPEKDYIKRLIALPGDTVYYTADHQLKIKPACETAEQQQSAMDANLKCGIANLIERKLVEPYGFEGDDVYSENLAGVEHQTLVDRAQVGQHPYLYVPQAHMIYEQVSQQRGDISKRVFFAKTEYSSYIENWQSGVVVPEGQYFAMGDNRTGSSDSRFWGFVPEERMVGKAEAIWLHLEFGFDQRGFFHWVPTGVNFDRVGAIK